MCLSMGRPGDPGCFEHGQGNGAFGDLPKCPGAGYREPGINLYHWIDPVERVGNAGADLHLARAAAFRCRNRERGGGEKICLPGKAENGRSHPFRHSLESSEFCWTVHPRCRGGDQPGHAEYGDVGFS